jgi:cobalt/nickel transport system permease protein
MCYYIQDSNTASRRGERGIAIKHSFIDRYADCDGPLQRVDPRVKLIAALVAVVLIVTTPNAAWPSFAAYALLAGGLLALSRLPLRFVCARLLTAAPFVILIAAFIPFMAAGARAPGAPWFHPSREGLALFLGVVVKSLLSIVCLVILTSTTRFDRLLGGAESMGCPRLVAMILSFMYRYAFLITDDLMRMVRAKEARGPERRPWRDLAALSSMVGVLFVRSYERAERVYLAMCARGFDGTVIPRRPLALAPRDLACLAAAVACFAAGRFAGGIR